MARQMITKTGIEYDTITFVRVKQADGTYLYFKEVTYMVLTDEEAMSKSRQRGPLVGAARTRLIAEFIQTDSELLALEAIPPPS